MSAKSEPVTQIILHRWFNYDPATGLFTWKERPPKSTRAVGSVAGSVQKQHNKMRRVLWVEGKRIYASRAAFVFSHGDIPATALVDHINGNTTDDRLENLRLASAVQNVWNRLEGSAVKKGVVKDVRGRFKARISVQGAPKINLGTWDTEAEAHAAYMGAAAVLHGDFWLGNRPGRN